ncbi:MAG: tyrosine-type recombinase/integrase [Prevotellaceae bacterium]|nr:tyrosine-type recombinase/integrase [Prevotellaceae bacterium]
MRHYGPHSLRHGCATRLINLGFSLKEVADQLGHQQLDTTRIYAKVDINNLRKVADMNWEGIL